MSIAGAPYRNLLRTTENSYEFGLRRLWGQCRGTNAQGFYSEGSASFVEEILGKLHNLGKYHRVRIPLSAPMP